MKVYTYDLGDSRFMSNFLPTDAANVIVYDKNKVVDVSAIYSNATEGNWVAMNVIKFWHNPQSFEVLQID